MSDKHKILIVDDSRMIRKGLSEIFSRSDEFEVVAEAADGEQALRAIQEAEPDLVTLDVVMPGMDGLTVLKHIMIERPLPTVMLSSLTMDGSNVTFDALRYGAVDFINKSSMNGDNSGLSDQTAEILKKLSAAIEVDVDAASYIRPLALSSEQELSAGARCERLVGIGAAEGGYGALMKIIPALSRSSAAYVAVLYVEDAHLDAFTAYLNNYSQVRVKRAEHNEVIEAGNCYLICGSQYLTVHENAGEYVFHLNSAPFTTRRGSIDRLFFSIAEVVESGAIGVILSGAGVDGVEGLQEIERVGGIAVVQDSRTSLAKEMPVAAIEALSPERAIADIDVAAKLNALLQTA